MTTPKPETSSLSPAAVAGSAQGPGPLAGQAYHLIGVGGAGMSVVAQLLAGEGARVSGSDAHGGEAFDRLVALGLDVYVGHDASRLPAQATVVVSTAIKDSNVELAAARERGQEVIHRSQALALAAGSRRFVAVAGAHGKTTTSGMLAQALTVAGCDPSFAVGGVVSALGSGAHVGGGNIFVAEADESDRSFLNYAPTVEVVLNVEPDHLDNYGTREAFEQAFVDFSARLVEGGTLVACADDAGALRLAVAASAAGRRVITFGTAEPGADCPGVGYVRMTVTSHSADGSHSTLTSYKREAEGWCEVQQVALELAVPGAHVALDAAGAWAAGVTLGVDGELMAQSLGAFGGTGRRFESRGEVAGVRVVDDYAHHPTEIEALMRAAREVARSRGGRVLVLFQPHLFSRTQNFADRFAAALAGADRAVITSIYPARETQEQFPSVSGQSIIDAGRAAGVEGTERLAYVADPGEAVAGLVQGAGAGDLILTVGAGDVTAYGPQILAALAAREQESGA